MNANHMSHASIVAHTPEASSTRVNIAASAARDTRFLAVDGGRIAYDDTGGNGPLIVAIPGMGDLRSQYRLVRPELEAAGYRVVTMDVRGFGETSAQWADLSAQAVGRDALALIDHLDAGPAVILGNSFAAGSALWAAHDAPERVSGVVLRRAHHPRCEAVLDAAACLEGRLRRTMAGVVLDHLLAKSLSGAKARRPEGRQSGAGAEPSRTRAYGRARCDGRPVQGRDHGHHTLGSGARPRRDGHERC